jgi:hypothetical protein
MMKANKLKDFLHHLNGIHQCIQFIMETELGLYISRRPNGSLGHKAYHKPTYSNLSLNVKSHHHPSNRQAVLSTLVHRARALCDQDSLQAKLVFLRDVFKHDGYNDPQIHRALNCHLNFGRPDNKPNSVAFLPFVGPTSNRIHTVLA